MSAQVSGEGQLDQSWTQIKSAELATLRADLQAAQQAVSEAREIVKITVRGDVVDYAFEKRCHAWLAAHPAPDAQPLTPLEYVEDFKRAAQNAEEVQEADSETSAALLSLKLLQERCEQGDIPQYYAPDLHIIEDALKEQS